MASVLEAVERALEDRVLQEGVRRAAESAEARVPEVLARFPFIERLAREVEEAKRRVIENLEEYVERAVEALKRVRARPYVAETAEEAREYVGRVVGRGKLVVMSKSMVAEEIGLREYLERLGNEVW